MIRTAWGSATDAGLARGRNEDCLVAFPPVFAVADGMGGEGGAAASRAAVEELSALAGLGPVDVEDVHAALERGAARAAGLGAGTTVAGIVLARQPGRPYWLVFNVGDSRVYRRRGDGVEQITADHSWVGSLVEAGRLSREDARVHPQRNVVTRVLGAGPARPDYWLLPTVARDRLLLCTDGLVAELPDARIGALLADPDPQAAAQALVDAALAAGGRDNVSVVVVDVVHQDLQPVDAGATAPRWGAADETTVPRTAGPIGEPW